MSLPEDIADDQARPWCKDVAEYLIGQLNRQNLQIEIVGPFEDEDAWVFYVTFESEQFWIAVQWSPLGRPQQPRVDYFVIQIGESKSIFRPLMWWKKRATHLVQICNFVGHILQQMPDVNNLKWLKLTEYIELT